MSVKVGLITGHPLFKYYSLVAAMPPRAFVGHHQAAALWRVWADALLCATRTTTRVEGWMSIVERRNPVNNQRGTKSKSKR